MSTVEYYTFANNRTIEQHPLSGVSGDDSGSGDDDDCYNDGDSGGEISSSRSSSSIYFLQC